MKTILQSIRAILVFTLLTGVLYPLAVTGLSQVLFPKQAAGSFLQRDGQTVGSALLAQKITSPRYFWPRPSAADYATVASGASNKGPTSADLVQAIADRRATFGADAPVDLLTASASGLDPDISPAAARFQIDRVAAARNLDKAVLMVLVEKSIEPPQYGIFGEPRVNVLRLNLALDRL